MSEWISVKDRLPEEDGLYLIWYSSDEMYSVCHYHRKTGWITYDESITYWMLLPEPPKKERMKAMSETKEPRLCEILGAEAEAPIHHGLTRIRRFM